MKARYTTKAASDQCCLVQQHSVAVVSRPADPRFAVGRSKVNPLGTWGCTLSCCSVSSNLLCPICISLARFAHLTCTVRYAVPNRVRSHMCTSVGGAARARQNSLGRDFMGNVEESFI